MFIFVMYGQNCFWVRKKMLKHGNMWNLSRVRVADFAVPPPSSSSSSISAVILPSRSSPISPATTRTNRVTHTHTPRHTYFPLPSSLEWPAGKLHRQKETCFLLGRKKEKSVRKTGFLRRFYQNNGNTNYFFFTGFFSISCFVFPLVRQINTRTLPSPDSLSFPYPPLHLLAFRKRGGNLGECDSLLVTTI